MIAATHKCGCLPKEKEPPCSPCCAAAKKVKIKTPAPADHSEGPCCQKQSLSSNLSCTNVEEPFVNECCPTEPEDLTPVSSPKVRSDIAKRGLPYKELEAIINDNRVVIRTQREDPRPEYDPPCDCNEDLDAPVLYEEKEPVQNGGNRTVTLISHSMSAESVSEEKRNIEEEEPKPIVRLENPNMFLLRVRRISKHGENIDLEFKTPRPWSQKKLLEYCAKIRPHRPPTVQCNEIFPEDEQRKQTVPRRGKKRKRK